MSTPTALAAPPSYDPIYFDRLFAVEDRHFWFRARNRAIAALAGQITAGWERGYRVLEIGCGTGNVLRVLEQACRGGLVVGMDLFAEGLHSARKRTSCPLVQGDIHRLPFSVSFDLVCLFDVLEHLADDRAVLRTLHGLTAPGGTLFLTVPAHPALWSYFDEASHHCRRYREQELCDKLVTAGFELTFFTPYMASILPLVWLGRKWASWFRRGQANDRDGAHALVARELRITPGINGLLTFLLSREVGWLTRRRRLPFGTSFLALARRPHADAALKAA